MVKSPPANTGYAGSIPGLGRSSGEGNGNPLQLFLPRKSLRQRILAGYSAWGSQKSWTRLVNLTTTNTTSRLQSVQLLSHVQLFATSWTAARQVTLSITNSWSLLKLMSIELVMPSICLILCRPLLLLPSIFPSIRVFSNESVLHIRWPKYWSFSFRISPSNEYSRLIFFRIDWLDLLAVQGILKSLLQHHSSKALILWHSAFFIIRLSHPYMTTGKTLALTRQTFVSKSLCFLICYLGWSQLFLEEASIF